MSTIPVTVAGLCNILCASRKSDEVLIGRMGSYGQEEAVRTWGEANGYEIVGYARDGMTPHWVDLDEREGFKWALSALQLPHVTGLVVHRLDRISREIDISLEAAERIWDTGSDLYSTDLGRIPRGKRGRDVIVRAAMYGGEELDAARARMEAGKWAKAKHGGYTGGNRFYGRPYGRIRQGSNWAPVPEEQEQIRRMIAACPNGKGYTAMAKQLNEEGVPTVSGTALWSAKMIRTLVLDQSKTLTTLTAHATPVTPPTAQESRETGAAGIWGREDQSQSQIA